MAEYLRSNHIRAFELNGQVSEEFAQFNKGPIKMLTINEIDFYQNRIKVLEIDTQIKSIYIESLKQNQIINKTILDLEAGEIKEPVPEPVQDNKNKKRKYVDDRQQHPINFTLNAHTKWVSIKDTHQNVDIPKEYKNLKFYYSFSYKTLFKFQPKTKLPKNINCLFVEEFGGLYILDDRQLRKYRIDGVAQHWTKNTYSNGKFEPTYFHERLNRWVAY